jgi:hypothetical protein
MFWVSLAREEGWDHHLLVPSLAQLQVVEEALVGVMHFLQRRLHPPLCLRSLLGPVALTSS